MHLMLTASLHCQPGAIRSAVADVPPNSQPDAAGPGPGSSGHQPSEWRQELLDAADVGRGQLVRLTLRGRIGEGMPYRQAVATPIMLRGRPHLKVACFTERQVGLLSTRV
jgi:hypothetical protein